MILFTHQLFCGIEFVYKFIVIRLYLFGSEKIHRCLFSLHSRS